MKHLIDWRIAGMIFAGSLTMATIPGCGEDSPLGDIAKECGLVCPEEGIAEGNASISGVVSVDAFFGAVVNFSGKATLMADNIDAELGKIKASLGLEADASAADIKAAMIAEFELDADADIVITFEPAKCEASARATVEASARCEGSVTPPMATVECSGSCQAEASAMATCDAEATAKCVGTAPNLQCEGECSGTCELEVAATCEGTCKGTCMGTCSASGAMGECNGACDGECQGTCEMGAKGTCSGQCKGECEYTPPSGMCEVGASLRCEASAMATVECSGKCDGEVTPPEASAECEASAKAEASVSVECTPPKLALEYQFAANASANAQANFEGFLTGFTASFGKIAAEIGRGEVLLAAGADLTAAASGAVSGAVDAALEGDVSLKAKVGLGCALTELDNVGAALSSATGKINASLSATAELTAAFGG
jgi:hypothetical protein